MRRIISVIIIFITAIVAKAQINIEYLNNVPQEFKEKYYSKKREYNPLQVGNVWQYYDAEYNVYTTTRVVKDSIINGKQYFKKISYEIDPPKLNFISWERNDITSGVSFMLDFQDVNENGDSLDELPLDSLENPYWSRYTTYKYSFEEPNPFGFFPGEKTVLIKDTSWVKIEGDTLISRNYEILEAYWWEMIIEKFGIYANSLESPIRFCSGAIVNGKHYGTIVSVNENNLSVVKKFILGNNYPNPFNPTTTIYYSIPDIDKGKRYTGVKMIVYDAIGRKIKTLIEEQKLPGTYRVTFNATGLPSGIYYYSLISGAKRITKPMMLIK
jgi:hypothetical protein